MWTSGESLNWWKKAKLAFLCFCSKVSRKRERKQEEPFLSDRGNKWKVKTVRVGIFRWERVGLRSKNLKYVRQENQRGWEWLFSLLSSTYSHHSQFQSFHSLNHQDIGRKSTLKINSSAFLGPWGSLVCPSPRKILYTVQLYKSACPWFFST